MTDERYENVPMSETERLAQIQAAMRIFAFLLNLAALSICLYLLRNFRTQGLQPSFLSTALFFASAFLIAGGILFLVLGWVERRKAAASASPSA